MRPLHPQLLKRTRIYPKRVGWRERNNVKSHPRRWWLQGEGYIYICIFKASDTDQPTNRNTVKNRLLSSFSFNSPPPPPPLQPRCLPSLNFHPRFSLILISYSIIFLSYPILSSPLLSSMFYLYLSPS